MDEEAWPGQEEQQWPGSEEAQRAPLNDAQKSMVDGGPVGRILNAFGSGFTAPIDGELGLDPKSINWLRSAGTFPSADPETAQKTGFITRGIQTFNEAMMVPAARDLNAVFNTVFESPFTSLAAGIGQISAETGLSTALGYAGEAASTQASNVADDVLGAMNTAFMLSGAHMELPPITMRLPPPDMLVPSPGAVGRFLRGEHGGSEPPLEPPLGELPPVPPPPPDAPRMSPTPPPEGPRKAGNINLDRINAPEDVKQVINDTTETNAGFEGARRGRMTFDDISQLANAVGMSSAALVKRKVGQAFNAEQAVAARNVLVASADKVRDLAKTAAGGTDEDMIAFQQAVTRHAAIQEQVSGLTAEAGRALSSFNIKSEATERAKALSQLIEAHGGRDSIQTIINGINGLDTPEKVSQFIRNTRKVTTIDKIVEFWINGLVSGPKTQVANAIGNSLTALNSVVETKIASALGSLHEGEKIVPGEAGARAFAVIQGSKDGVTAARHAWSTGTGYGGKVEGRTPAIEGKAGEIIRTPTRALFAADTFFKSIAARQELSALAYRQASTEGLTGEAFTNRIADILANPDAKMMEKAHENASYQTFQKPLGETGKFVQKVFERHPILKFIAPFIRTPIDIMKYAGERTPLALFSKEIRNNLAGKNGNIARDTQASRLILGTGVLTTAFAFAANGSLTGGGPKDANARALLYMTGWQPYSVRVGSTFYSYARLDPFASMLGAAADAYEIGHRLSADESASVGGLIMASVVRNLLNKTWLQGPADAFQAMEDPERYGDPWVRGLVSSFVPTAVADVARSTDPYIHSARTIIEGVKARVPGLSQTLPNKRDLWGNEVQREGSLGNDIASPIYQTQIKNDPVATEMLNIGLWKAPVDKKIRDVKLDDQQYDDYARVAGRMTRLQLSQIVGMPGWSALPMGERYKIMDRIFTKSRDMAEKYTMASHPNLLQGIVKQRIESVTGKPVKAGVIVPPAMH